MAIRIEPILIGLLVGGVKEEKIPEEEERRKKNWFVVPALATTHGVWVVVGVDFLWSLAWVL
jgi:hypothetical protein